MSSVGGKDQYKAGVRSHQSVNRHRFLSASAGDGMRETDMVPSVQEQQFGGKGGSAYDLIFN